MITTSIRKQGGAAIITIPAQVLKMLDVNVGSKLELEVHQDEFVVRSLSPKKRKRYTMKELLRGATSENMKKIHKSTEWFRDGDAIGRELL